MPRTREIKLQLDATALKPVVVKMLTCLKPEKSDTRKQSDCKIYCALAEIELFYCE